jgi:hypothetical protein
MELQELTDEEWKQLSELRTTRERMINYLDGLIITNFSELSIEGLISGSFAIGITTRDFQDLFGKTPELQDYDSQIKSKLLIVERKYHAEARRRDSQRY